MWEQISFLAAGTISLLCAGTGLLWAHQQHALLVQDPHSAADDESLKLASDIRKESIFHISKRIQDGAMQFLQQEYSICGVVVVFMAVGISILISLYSAFAFVLGAVTSIACGYFGMAIATYSNCRTTMACVKNLEAGFKTALRAGSVIGFTIVSVSLAVMVLLIGLFYLLQGCYYDYYEADRKSCLKFLFESVAGFGLGGSTVALFGRVGGGIYTKAADVGADLVGKVQKDLPEDSPRNPATIADNVGDNVGDVAGMSADLFGSLAESTCAALLLSSDSLLSKGDLSMNNQSYPLVVVAFGILACVATNYVGLYLSRIKAKGEVETTLKQQLVLSTLLLTPALYLAAILCFPPEFSVGGMSSTRLEPFLCSLGGLWAGLLIGWFTQYVTSFSYGPVRELANSCRTGAATNIIYGLSLGYFSTLVPVLLIVCASFLSLTLLGFYGVSLAALGMLSNLPLGLAIDSYGPISDNAGGIAEMAGLGEHVRERTDILDSAGNTTAAIGKGFAIGSAALVSLALYGAFLHVADIKLQICDPSLFTGLLLGSMLPYVFSALTMKAVGKAALGMVQEVRSQIRKYPGILTGEVEPDYRACIRISARESLREMVLPGLLVILSPIVTGLLLGPGGLAGLLPGGLVSGVQMAISASNTGGAWDNAKKYIEGGYLVEGGAVVRKGSQIHKAAVVGDTVGDPLKDTSGPSLNILIKLMAILSLVLTPFFQRWWH